MGDSKPCIKTGMHFDLSNSKVTSSEAILPILPNIALAERKKRLFGVIYGTSKLSALCNVYTKITYNIKTKMII